MSTEWREIPGWEGYYAVSDDGQVKSLARSVQGRPGVLINKRERLLTSQINSSGYLVVWLCRDNKRTQVSVHRLVLSAFVGPCPEGMEGCHNNGNPSDNRVENLRWDSRSENTKDRVRHGTHPFAARTQCPRGHAYDRVNNKGGRVCSICANAQKREARRKAA